MFLKDPLAADRLQMVQQLEKGGIRDRRVLAAMLRTPREEFLDPAQRARAYADCPLPIGCKQTISQPYTVAFMCEAAMPKETDHALEIGAGSGYGAAVLSRLVRFVDTVERLPKLAARAASTIAQLNYRNIAVHLGDGIQGLPGQAPFEVIIVTAGARTVPQAYLEQLAEGGRLIIPIGDDSQTMFRYTRRGETFDVEELGEFYFVPLVGSQR
jgi:protein-L-isoaspartate(D-aspartate) O-methyltransferase